MKMDIENELSNKIKSAIKDKLVELGAYVDEELPDYIMVMVANKKTQESMTNDLNLFLGDNADKFSAWLHGLLKKLQSASVESRSQSKPEAIGPQRPAPTSSPPERRERDLKRRSPVVERRAEKRKTSSKPDAAAPKRDEPELAITAESGEFSDEEPTSKRRPESRRPRNLSHTSRNDFQRHPRSLRTSARDNHPEPKPEEVEEEEEEEYDPRHPAVESVIHVTERRKVPSALAPTSSLILRAVREANDSVKAPKRNPRVVPVAREDVEVVAAPNRNPRAVREEVEVVTAPKRNPRAVREEVEVVTAPKRNPRAVPVVREVGPLELFTRKNREDLRRTIQRRTENDGRDVRIVSTTPPVPDDEAEPEVHISIESMKEEVEDVGLVIETRKGGPPGGPRFVVTLEGIRSEDFDHVMEEETDEQEEQEMLPEGDTPQERCRYWPACKNGEACPYVHPSKPCLKFPACKFNDKCLFIHPNCKFDARCTRQKCPYTHASPRGAPQAAPAIAKSARAPFNPYVMKKEGIPPKAQLKWVAPKKE